MLYQTLKTSYWNVWNMNYEINEQKRVLASILGAILFCAKRKRVGSSHSAEIQRGYQMLSKNAKKYLPAKTAGFSKKNGALPPDYKAAFVGGMRSND